MNKFIARISIIIITLAYPISAAEPIEAVAVKASQTTNNTAKNKVKDESGKLIWNPPKEAVPTKNPPKDWKIEVFREKKYNHSHTLKDGTIVSVEVTPFILTPSNPSMVYFLEPGYNPTKGMNHNMPESIKKQNEYIDKTISDLQAIATQLEKLREWVRTED